MTDVFGTMTWKQRHQGFLCLAPTEN